ncbi:restriction endonuclease subunit S [Azospirillum agricola]|uniref:restriction endonuclease subunit S n=1 Tax=Azospirillum agricola TaxID=1720247 RepID=UPI000A0F1BEC|nr:restriction endonuclease subunit S [Azospirillum agricola]SMH58576.1 type I restriction enzyme, S subunit [Azospirillum lipoferum]
MSGRELPSTWAWCEFRDVANVASDLVDPQLTPDAPHVAPNHVSSWTGELIEKSTVRNDAVTSPKHRFRTGQIVYSKIRPYLAKAIFADFDGLCSADMYPIESRINARFLLRWMLTKEFTDAAAQSQGRTVLPKINQESLQKLPVPVPPLPEQRRIVEKIEALTARSRRAREALDSLPALIDRYRQSILAAAFRGNLTADWRTAHPESETADGLLHRIGIAVTEVDPEDRPLELPPSWRWARLVDIADVKGGLAKGKKRTDGVALRPVPYLRVANVQRGYLDISEVKEIEASQNEIEQLRLLEGDILFNEGGDRDKLGRGWVWSGEIETCIHQNHVFRARLRSSELNPFLISHFGNTFGQSYFSGNGTQSVNLASISLSKLKAFPVPVIPPAEQVELYTRVQEALRRVEVFHAAWFAASERLPSLDQSILAKAFRGELVPQDPNDEPASVLLERIHTERAAAGAAPRRGRRART